MIDDRPPLVALDAATWEELAGPADALRARGWNVIDLLHDPPLRTERLVCRALIVDSTAAEAAVLAASWGAGLLIGIGGLDRDVRDRLVDDLERIAPLVRSMLPAHPPIHEEAARLLDLLASGRTLGDAARAAYISRRTADRRLADAKRTLGAASTAEVIALWVKRPR